MRNILFVSFLAAATVFSSCMTNMMAGSGIVYENAEQYDIISRSDAPEPTSFTPDYSGSDVTLVVEPVLHGESIMMKKATVGSGDGRSWEFLCDEGMGDYHQQAPNPLSYMIAGSAMNLLNQLSAEAISMGIELDDLKVEQRVSYRQPGLMTDDCYGYADTVMTSILIESSESEQRIIELTNRATASWEAGEGYELETPIHSVLNTDNSHFDTHYAKPGLISETSSMVDGYTVIYQQVAYPAPTTFEAEEDFQMSLFNMNLEFEMIAVAERIEDLDNPYRSKAVIRCNLPGYMSWTIFSDDAALYGGESSAPTTLDYFTAGTGLCLTTQVTGAIKALNLDVRDYRIEQRIGYNKDTTTDVDTYVVFNSDEEQKDLEQLFNLSLQMCFAGEGLSYATEMETTLFVNESLVE